MGRKRLHFAVRIVIGFRKLRIVFGCELNNDRLWLGVWLICHLWNPPPLSRGRTTPPGGALSRPLSPKRVHPPLPCASAERWRAMKACFSALNARGTTEEARTSAPRREEDGEDASAASVWSDTQKKRSLRYSSAHHRPCLGNSIRLHPVTARLHLSLCQFFLTFLNRTVSPSLTFVW